jgi:hypothetical protein
MTEGMVERRACERFRVPGATVCFRREARFWPGRDVREEFCPLIDLSRGGLRFLSQVQVKPDAKLAMEITIPGQETPLLLRGIVRWVGFNAGKSYRFQAGVQFHPYGTKKSHNPPEALKGIIALEQKAMVKRQDAQD